jgi:hypothetical protein
MYKWVLIALLSCAFFFHQADRAVKDIEHALVGKDPFDTEWIWHENYRQLPPEDFKKALKCVEKVKESTKNITSDHWLRHYAGTLTNVRPPDSVKYYHG